MIGGEFRAEQVLEQFNENPFLAKFYADPVHYAFPVEMTFLMERYRQLKKLLSERDLFTDFVIGDYFIDKCVIFSRNNLLPDEYNLYRSVFDVLSSYLPKPDIILYLYSDIPRLLRNIAGRGREYEKNISADYLEHIQQSYLTYFKEHADMPVLLLEASKLDFVQNPDDYGKIKALIKASYPAGVHRITF